MKMPSVTVSFRERGVTAIQRSERGIIAMVLEDDITKATNKVVYTTDDIEKTWSEDSKEQVQLALMGYQTTPKKILVYFIAKTADKAEQDYTEIEKRLEGARWDYLVIPQLSATKTQEIATFIKGMRETKDTKVKAVLPNCAADSEGVVNFTNTVIKTATKTYTAAQYCSRVAGIICGTPAKISCTYAPAPELIEVEAQTKDEMDARVGKGEFFFFADGEKIKVARGINSFVTTVDGKGEDFKKIKLVDLLDMIHYDIKKTGHDSYIGKYANSEDNRALLVTAIQGYVDGLEHDGLLERNQNKVYINCDAVKLWREQNGLNTKEELSTMKDSEVKSLNIHDQVFISTELSPLDAIEDIKVENVIE